MTEYRRGNHSVYLVTYHIVFVTKYRRKCINDEMGEYLKADLTRIIGQNKGHVHAVEYDCDHIHLLAELPIDQSVSKFIGVLKGSTARNVRRDFASHLSHYYRGDSFWEDSYFIASTGGVSMDVIKKYVESQRTEKRRPGRPKTKNRAYSSQTDAMHRSGSSTPKN